MAKDKQSSINSGALSSLLKRVHLKGLLGECVVEFKKGVGYISAVDITNSVFISCQESIPGWDGPSKVGIGNLALVCKYMDDRPEGVSISLTDTQLVLKGGKGSTVRAQLVEPDMIPTSITDDGVKKKMLSLATITITPVFDKVEDLVYHLDLLKPPSVVLHISRGTLTASTNDSQEDQFKLVVGTSPDRKASRDLEDIRVEVYTDHFLHVLRYFIGEKKVPDIMFGPEAPIILHLNDTNIWALTPIQD